MLYQKLTFSWLSVRVHRKEKALQNYFVCVCDLFHEKTPKFRTTPISVVFIIQKEISLAFYISQKEDLVFK